MESDMFHLLISLYVHRLLNLYLESRGTGIRDSETFPRTGLSASLRWSNVFVDMRSLVRYKVLTDASGEVASSFAKCNWHYSQHKETYKWLAIRGLELWTESFHVEKNAQL